MSDESGKSFQQIIAEKEARLRQELADLAEFKRLATKLNIALPGDLPPQVAASVPPAISHVSSGDLFPAISQNQPVNAVVIRPNLNRLPTGLTVKELIDTYRTHPDSPYHQLKYRVRLNYDGQLDRYLREIGHLTIAEFDTEVVQALYDGWTEGEKFATGHAMIGKLRLLCTFGLKTLKNEDCIRLSTILNKMRFPLTDPSQSQQTQHLTHDQARAIRRHAHEAGLHSIAMIQAFQVDVPQLRQMDIIGEWVPLTEPGETDIIVGSEKWLRGIRWSEIDERLVLRHTVTSGRRDQHRKIEVDLNRTRMVAEEMSWFTPAPSQGPVAICEITKVPWTGAEFRRRWRAIADQAGVPKTVRNVDSGGNSSAKSDRVNRFEVN